MSSSLPGARSWSPPPAVRYHDARFLPDGRSLLALADSTGELEFWRIPVSGQGTPVQLTRDARVLRRDGVPSPDGLRLASQDQDLRLWIHDLATGEDIRVASSRHGAFRDLRWSPDGRWLAYVQPGENAVSRIWIYGVDDGLARVVTTDRFDSYSPTWGLDGAWLYFLSDRTFESTVASPWGARQPEPFFDRQTSVYELALRPGARSRFATADERSTPLREAIVTVDDGIDFDGLPSRLGEVPLVPGNYSHLETDGERLYFLAWDASSAPRKRLAMMPMDDRRKLDTVASGVLRYELSSDRTRLLLETANHFHVVDADGTIPDDLSRTRLKLDDWSMTVLPREEWRQIFVDAWRLQRDGFYDRHMHGVDWQAIRQRYEPLLARLTDRAELSDLIAQMVGELSALHMFVRGADERKPDEQVVASLGATVTRDTDGGGYRVVDVLRGDTDRPDERSPLAAAPADVRAGDVIMAVDGVSTLAAPDLSVLLRGGVGRSVRLRVRTARSEIVRDVTVRPVSMRREADLRYAAWETGRRQQVDDASKRQIGYLHLRGMTAADMAQWQRAFYPVQRRPALIIDLRRNTGGNIDSWLLSRLLRQAWFFWQPRTGEARPNMPSAYQGHVAVLVDQETASDGEAFAEGIKRLGLGVVIGTRTWGGELWGSGGTALLDKGTAAVPETGVFGTDGTWLIEGHGVDPDIIVDNLPRATFDGHDAQLDAAVTYLTRRIREAPVPAVAPPPYPDKRAPAAGTHN